MYALDVTVEDFFLSFHGQFNPNSALGENIWLEKSSLLWMEKNLADVREPIISLYVGLYICTCMHD